MIIPVTIKSNYIRQLPNEFYNEPACSIICHLDGVIEPNDSISSNIIAQCINLLSENEYEIIVNDYHHTTGGKIILLNNGRNINNEIKQLLISENLPTLEDELNENFRYQLQLSIGDEVKALLSSFSGKDDTFYVLIINENTAAIDRAMSELQEDHIPNRDFLQIPQIKTYLLILDQNKNLIFFSSVSLVLLLHDIQVIENVIVHGLNLLILKKKKQMFFLLILVMKVKYHFLISTYVQKLYVIFHGLVYVFV